MVLGNLTSIEWLALIVVIFSIIKTIVVLSKPSAWGKFAVKMYSKPVVTGIVAFILALGVLFVLLDSGITITQIFAVTLFVVLLVYVGISAYSKEMGALASKLLKDHSIVKKSWFYIVIWLALVIWVLYEIFM